MIILPGIMTATEASRRLSPRRLAGFGIAILMLLVGAASLGDGVYIKAKAGVAQVLLERAWVKTLSVGANANSQQKRRVKPWPWADVWPVAKISVPGLGRQAIVLSGVSGQAMAFGPGLMDGLSNPGEPGLSVIAAHRDTHFRFLEEIDIGERVDVTNAGGELTSYEIIETRIVDARRSGLDPRDFLDDGVQWSDNEKPTSTLALVTCYPFNATKRGPLRFVALARPLRQPIDQKAAHSDAHG